MWTSEEVSICREIAKRWRKEIVRGDWYVLGDTNHVFIHDHDRVVKDATWISLLTIEDCLAELERRGLRYGIYMFDPEDIRVEVYSNSDVLVELDKEKQTRLACLKALLSVLEGPDG